MPKTAEASDSDRAERFLRWLVDVAISGTPELPGGFRLSSALELADEYLRDGSYRDNDERVDALIRWETSKSFTAGFLGGLGGVLTIPVSLPGTLVAAWVVQARMAAAVARIYGHDPREDRVQTFVLLSILGKFALDAVKKAAEQIGIKLGAEILKQIPGHFLIAINQQVGFKLVTKTGQRGIVNLIKGVPLIGGIVGGTIDAVTCRAAGSLARSLFRRKDLGAGLWAATCPLEAGTSDDRGGVAAGQRAGQRSSSVRLAGRRAPNREVNEVV